MQLEVDGDPQQSRDEPAWANSARSKASQGLGLMTLGDKLRLLAGQSDTDPLVGREIERLAEEADDLQELLEFYRSGKLPTRRGNQYAEQRVQP